MHAFALLLALAAPTPAAAPVGPNEVQAAALRDARTLPADAARYTRYLSTYALRPAAKADFLKTLAFHVNQLSRESEIVAPVRVGDDLYRVNLLDYQWDPKTWERLADVEPHFHVRLVAERDEVEQWGKRRDDGGWYDVEERKTGRKVRSVTVAAAPWLDPKAAAELATRTQSAVPVVRADWFLVQTAIQRGGQVGYYDFLGLGNKEADFLRLIGADKEAARRLRKEVAATLSRSGVALQNRHVTRLQSLTGPYWFTADFKTSANKQNTLRLLDGDTEPPAGDASEQYGTLPNGLPAYWLQDANGNRQDAVPPDIAHDRFATGNDLQIYAGKSCITCHAEVIRPVDDYARRLYRGAVKLQAVDYARFVRLRQLYLSDLDGQVRDDQAAYARAILRASGRTPADNARAFGRAWDDYAEAGLLPADAAREIGVAADDLLAGLKRSAAGVGRLDPVLAALVQEPPLPVRREHFDEALPLLYLALKGYVQP
jgi:hypothetical protein